MEEKAVIESSPKRRPSELSGTERFILPKHSDFNIVPFDCDPNLDIGGWVAKRPFLVQFTGKRPVAPGELFMLQFTATEPGQRQVSLTCRATRCRLMTSFETFMLEAKVIDAHPADLALLRENCSRE